MSAAITRQRIATGQVDKRTARGLLREEFERARAEYVATCTQIVATIEAIGNHKVAIEHHESNMKGVEAGWLAAGEYDTCKNDRERQAVTALLRGSDPDYRSLAVAAANTKGLLAGQEATYERQKLTIRLARMDIEMAIAELHAIAGEEVER